MDGTGAARTDDMAGERESHVSPTLSSVIGGVAVLISLGSVLMSMPNGRDIVRIDDTLKLLTAEASTMTSTTAKNMAALDTLRAQIEGNDRVFVNLHANLSSKVDSLGDNLESVRKQQIINQEREARMDEALRILDSSVPPMASRLSTLEAKMEASMRTIDLAAPLKTH